MATLDECLNALVAIAAQTIYPNGTGQPSIAGTDVRVYPGWPIPANLDDDIRLNKCHVSVFVTAAERNTIRSEARWQPASMTAPTLVLTVGDQVLTVAGTVAVPQNVAIHVNGRPYVYAVQQGDTLATIATGLAALIAVDVLGTASVGAAITAPSPARLDTPATGATGISVQEVRRQERVIQLTVWAPTPALRSMLLDPIDLAMANRPRITMPDGSVTQLRYRGSPVSDDRQVDNLYRRDLLLAVDYATVNSRTDTVILNSTATIKIKTLNLGQL